MPRYLRQSDIHTSGSGDENFAFEGQEFSENIGDSLLLSRNFVIADKVTSEMKKIVRENVEKLRNEWDKNAAEESQVG